MNEIEELANTDKIIIVKNCHTMCYLSDYDWVEGEQYWYCRGVSFLHPKEIEDANKVPDWCPLKSLSAYRKLSEADVVKGNYQKARGILPFKDGDELPETIISRARGNPIPSKPELKLIDTKMKRFTMFRKMDISTTHDSNQVNPPDEPQFEGVVFSDGKVAIRWLTAKRSVAVWDSMEDMLAIHGHPEYGSVLVWNDEAQLSADKKAIGE